MTKKDQNPNRPITTLPVANVDQLSVEFWRGLLPSRMTHFEGMMEAATKLGQLDDDFAGARGYFRLQNACQNKAGLAITAKAVQLIDSLFPPVSPTVPSTDRLARQGLTRKRN